MSDDPYTDGLSAGGEAAVFGPGPVTQPADSNGEESGNHDNGRRSNVFVNDPCLDPPPPARQRTMQSETEIAVFGKKYIVAGYNNSRGFYNNTEGLSGFAYSTNGGKSFVDGGGLPPVLPGSKGDQYFGDPVIAVDQSDRSFTVRGVKTEQEAGQFYYSSIYQLSNGTFTLSVNRGRFMVAPPQTPESKSNTRCQEDPTLQGVPDNAKLPKERIIWERPVVAVPVTDPGDLLDKEWLYVNQETGTLYLSYTRFGSDFSTPLEMVRSYDGGRTWTPPSVIVPNLDDTFNQATQPMVTGTGRVVVTYLARQFANGGLGPENDDRIEIAWSDNDGATFSPPVIVNHVNPQGEPKGYNRRRASILNAPYIAPQTRDRDIYIAYFNGKSPLGTVPYAKAADILLSSSHDNGATFTTTKVNTDPGTTSHVFPSVQVNQQGSVYVGWLDRRYDPSNILTDAFAAVSRSDGRRFSTNTQVSDVSTSWFTRWDARPNFGDYTSSELLDDDRFVMIWADGRFPPPGPTTPGVATPDVIFSIVNGQDQGNGNQGNGN